MTTLQKVCGIGASSPIAGQDTYQNDLLIGAFLHFIIVNDVNENGLAPMPDYTFDIVSGVIRRVNPWQLSDKVIFVYSKCCS